MQTPTEVNLSNVNFFTHHAKLSASADFKWRFEMLHTELVVQFPPEQRDLLDTYFERFCELHNLQLNSLFQDYLQFVCFLVDSLDATDCGSEPVFAEPVSQETFPGVSDESSATVPVGYTNTRRTIHWSKPSATQKTRSLDSFLESKDYLASGKREEGHDERAREKSKSISFRFRNKSPKKANSSTRREARSLDKKAKASATKGRVRTPVVNRNDAVLDAIVTEEEPIVYPYTDRVFAEKLVSPAGNLDFNLSWTPEFSNWSSNSPSPLADCNVELKDRS